MDLIGIGAIAIACILILKIPDWERKRRRREMGLEPWHLDSAKIIVPPGREMTDEQIAELPILDYDEWRGVN